MNGGCRIAGKPLFLLLLLVFALAGIGAFLATGDRGIEERFAHAVGMGGAHGEEEEGPALFGMRIEGTPLGYIAVLLLLAGAAAVLAYRYRDR